MKKLTQFRLIFQGVVITRSPVIAPEPVDVSVIFEPKIHYAYGKLNIDVCLYSAIPQLMYREGGDESAPLYSSKYWTFVNSIIGLAHELFEKDLSHLSLTLILLPCISVAMEDENGFNLAPLNGLVEKELDGDDYGWEIDEGFMERGLEDQLDILIAWREMLVFKARHLHFRLSYCIVHLNGYSFNVDYNGFKPSIDLIEEAEDVFTWYLVPADEDKQSSNQLGLDGELLSDSEEEYNSDDEEYAEGVQCALEEDEAIEDMYD